MSECVDVQITKTIVIASDSVAIPNYTERLCKSGIINVLLFLSGLMSSFQSVVHVVPPRNDVFFRFLENFCDMKNH